MKIDIKGTIIRNESKWIYDLFEMDATCPRDVQSALEEANGQDVDIYINSGGGDVFSGSEIYTAIRGYTGRAQIHVVGLAASAASVIMCAAPSDISPTAMVMIHNVSSYAEGNYLDMAHEAEVLQTASRALCTAYTEKTGKSMEEMQSLMDQEKWFTAAEAVEMGLCDEITGSGMQLVAALSPMIPKAVEKKLRSTLESEKEKWMAMGAANARFENLKEDI